MSPKKTQTKSVMRPCCNTSIKNTIERGQTIGYFVCSNCGEEYTVYWHQKPNGATGNFKHAEITK